MSSTATVRKVIPQAATKQGSQIPMTIAAYRGMGDDLWAQHSQLARFTTTCKDPEILAQITAARSALAEAGKLADRKSAKK